MRHDPMAAQLEAAARRVIEYRRKNPPKYHQAFKFKPNEKLPITSPLTGIRDWIREDHWHAHRIVDAIDADEHDLAWRRCEEWQEWHFERANVEGWDEAALQSTLTIVNRLRNRILKKEGRPQLDEETGLEREDEVLSVAMNRAGIRPGKHPLAQRQAHLTSFLNCDADKFIPCHFEILWRPYRISCLEIAMRPFAPPTLRAYLLKMGFEIRDGIVHPR